MRAFESSWIKSLRKKIYSKILVFKLFSIIIWSRCDLTNRRLRQRQKRTKTSSDYALIQSRSKKIMKMKQNSLALPLLLVLACSHLSQAQHQSFIVRVVQFIPPNVDINTFRCFGTVFTPNHVLTAASCATVLSPFAVACQHQEAIRAPDGTSVRIRKCFESSIRFHMENFF